MAQYVSPDPIPTSGSCNAANEITSDAHAQLRDYVCNRVRMRPSLNPSGAGVSAPAAGAKLLSFRWLLDIGTPFLPPGPPRLLRPVLTLTSSEAEFRPALDPNMNDLIYYQNAGVDAAGVPIWKVIEVPAPLADFSDTTVPFVPDTIRIHGEGARGALIFDPMRPFGDVDIWVEARPKPGYRSISITAVIEYSLALEASHAETRTVSFS